MGKSSSSCLKIITCSNDSAVEDDAEAPEGKSSGEKRGWSFRKRSTRHRVLSKSVTSEIVTLESKEISQSSTAQTQTASGLTIPEKVLALEKHIEKCQPPASYEPESPKSIEPELSESSNAPKPIEPEVSETLHAPKQQELCEKEVSKTLFTPKQTESFELEVPEEVDASESPELVEPETFVSGVESKSTYLVEPETFELEVPEEVLEAVAASALEPSSDSVESNTQVSVGESNSLNIEPIVPETVVSSAVEQPQPAESKISEVVVSDSLATAEPKQLKAVISSEDDILEEPIVVTIQTGVRGFLAQREIMKLRSIVKLQAAIRGHLVRRQAVDTLYCMQGIVKVQNLIRTRQSMVLGDGVSVNKTIAANSTEKLLGNAFARQLLNSTPKSKSTIIKCDPLKPSPAWTWLERWMPVSSSTADDSKTQQVVAEDVQFQAKKISPITKCVNSAVSESVVPEIDVQEACRALENAENSISSVPAEEYHSSNLLSSEKKMDHPNDYSTDSSIVESLGVAALNDQIIQSDLHHETQSVSLSQNLAVEIEELNLCTKQMPYEEIDVENIEFAYGSRKASSPAFLAAHSRFEELSSSAARSISLKSPHQDADVESHPNTVLSLEESVLKELEPSSLEAFIHDEARVDMGGSECGTELSVTSALDSPDRSEAEVAGMDLEIKYAEERASYPISDDNLGVKDNGHSGAHDSSLSASTLVQMDLQESNGVPKPVAVADVDLPQQKPEAIASDEHENGEYVVLNMAPGSPQVEQTLGSSASTLQVELGSQAEEPDYKLSPEATPNYSNMTVAESQGTPSSQVSVKTKRSKVDNSRSNIKHSSHSAGKRNAAKPLLDSGARNSAEKLPKDQKSGKRRNSFGSTKSDNIDQEPRDSTSSNKALPSYMQATQSAKAKSNSPRSSADLQDKDSHIIKKRHSLPGSGGKQVSPRVERPTSQLPQPQAVKANVSTPPQERKWLR